MSSKILFGLAALGLAGHVTADLTLETACYGEMAGVCTTGVEDGDDMAEMALACSKPCQTVLKGESCKGASDADDTSAEFMATMNSSLNSRLAKGSGGTTAGFFYCQCLVHVAEACDSAGEGEPTGDCCMKIFTTLGCADAQIDYPELKEYSDLLDKCQAWALTPGAAGATECVDALGSSCGVGGDLSGADSEANYVGAMAALDYDKVCSGDCQTALKGDSCKGYSTWAPEIEKHWGKLRNMRTGGTGTSEAFFHCGCIPKIKDDCADMTATATCCTSMFGTLACADGQTTGYESLKPWEDLFNGCADWRDAELAPAPTAALAPTAAAAINSAPSSDSSAGALSLATGLAAVAIAAMA